MGQEQYAQTRSIVARAAFPDTILLSTADVEYDSTGHAATITASLFSERGNHSLGLPLTYRAWKNDAGAQLEVGNFTAPGYQITAAASTYSIALDLLVPGVDVGDTIWVTSRCGNALSTPLRLFFID